MKAHVQRFCENASLEYSSKSLICLLAIISGVIAAWLIVNHRYSSLLVASVAIPCMLIGLYKWRWGIYVFLAYLSFAVFASTFQFEGQYYGYIILMLAPAAAIWMIKRRYSHSRRRWMGLKPILGGVSIDKKRLGDK